MKTLFLVRHAKSSRDNPLLADRDRPLDDRGKTDAPRLGARLAQRGIRLDLLVSSPALRALTTAQLFADALGGERRDIVVDDRLYACTAQAVLAIIHAFDAKLERVMLFGHNPEFSDLAGRLSGKRINMPTCAVAEFSFDTKTWSAVGETAPARVALDTPKNQPGDRWP
jgi:phosphohistidine phosphatase